MAALLPFSHCLWPCSRLAGRRLGFSPYSRDQLRQIVAARLEGCHLFDRSAISLITSKARLQYHHGSDHTFHDIGS
jgi:Cdc6-like AAA superfamily ATPase